MWTSSTNDGSVDLAGINARWWSSTAASVLVPVLFEQASNAFESFSDGLGRNRLPPRLPKNVGSKATFFLVCTVDGTTTTVAYR